MRKISPATAVSAVALSMVTQPVAAQISEMDRLQRCENNREALARSQNDLVMIGYMTDEQLARTRAALRVIRAAEEGWEVLSRAATTYQIQGEDQLSADALARGRQELERIRLTGLSVGVGCMDVTYICVWRIPGVVAGMVSSAEAARNRATPLLRQIEAVRTNLIALRCDQARAPDVADISGAWRGADGTTYSITQSGTQFSWTRSGTDERATGTISGASMSAQWASSQGSGGGSASIQFGANGVPVQIRWSNGNIFTR